MGERGFADGTIDEETLGRPANETMMGYGFNDGSVPRGEMSTPEADAGN